jgi:hypothetical protein
MATTEPPTTAVRDRFVDFVRAGSLVVVVLWHWAFTVLRWEEDGPHATNPIGFTKGLWLVTWVLQVMPLFFFVGGWSNLQAWRRRQSEQTRGFVLERLRSLMLPAFGLIAVWWVLLVGVSSLIELRWLRTSVVLILSPLWFAFTYALIISMFPVFVRLHQRYGYLAPIWLAGAAALVDIARFTHDVPYIGWLNMILVWGLAHQLGFFYRELSALPRRAKAAVAWSGGFFLVALVWSRIYPGSMVGVPGDKFSNMAPPSLAIVALIALQVGLLLLAKPYVERRLEEERWQRWVRRLNTYSMPLYLLHTSGLAIYLVAGYFINRRAPLSAEITWRWWALRPVAMTAPLLTTIPLLMLLGRFSNRRAAAGAPPRTGDANATPNTAGQADGGTAIGPDATNA